MICLNNFKENPRKLKKNIGKTSTIFNFLGFSWIFLDFLGFSWIFLDFL